MGTMHSSPTLSANCASRRLLSQEACHRSGTVVYERPFEQLEPNSPSLSALPEVKPTLRRATCHRRRVYFWMLFGWTTSLTYTSPRESAQMLCGALVN